MLTKLATITTAALLALPTAVATLTPDIRDDVTVRTDEGQVLEGQRAGVDILDLSYRRTPRSIVVAATHRDAGAVDDVVVSYDVTGNGVPDYEVRGSLSRLTHSVLRLDAERLGHGWPRRHEVSALSQSVDLPHVRCSPRFAVVPRFNRVRVEVPLSCFGNPESVRVSYLAEDQRPNYAYRLDAAPGMTSMSGAF